MCDDNSGCHLRAKWKLEPVDDSDDYYHVCNQHLGKLCEKIVKTTDIKYDVIYLKGKA